MSRTKDEKDRTRERAKRININRRPRSAEDDPMARLAACSERRGEGRCGAEQKPRYLDAFRADPSPRENSRRFSSKVSSAIRVFRNYAALLLPRNYAAGIVSPERSRFFVSYLNPQGFAAGFRRATDNISHELSRIIRARWTESNRKRRARVAERKAAKKGAFPPSSAELTYARSSRIRESTRTQSSFDEETLRREREVGPR